MHLRFSILLFLLLLINATRLKAQEFQTFKAVPDALSEFAGGEGTADDPWQVATPDHLNNIRNYTGDVHSDKHFLQIADINLNTPPWNEGDGWLPIANSSNRFEGSYNGAGYEIQGLYINRPGMGSLGLWGFVGDSGILHDVHLTEANVTGGAQIAGTLAGTNRGLISHASATGIITGGYRVGGLVGENNPGTVEYCYAHVSVNAANGRIGGLVGFNVGGTVYHSHTTANVHGGWYVGGVVGRNVGGTVQLCYATGNISGGNSVGGLVGDTEDGVIANCYATGSATGTFAVGGLVGYHWQTPLSNCYAVGAVGGGNFDHGGLIGYRFGGSVSNSYWNTETSGQSSSAGGTGKTTTQMTTQATFTNWDFAGTWSIIEGDSYPWLQWQGEPGSHNFPNKFIITLIPLPQESGTLTIDPDKNYFAEGEEMTLTASAHDGFAFVSWTDVDGAVVSDQESFLFTMPGSDVTLFANFEPAAFSVTFEVFDEDLLPINDATITLNDITNPAGNYFFDNLTAGTHTYHVVREGFFDVLDSLTITDQSLTVTVIMLPDVTGKIEQIPKKPAIYPNPANDIVHIQSDEALITSLRLLGATGNVIVEKAVDRRLNHSIRVESFQPGVYLLEVKTSLGTSVFKLLISRK